MKPPLHSAEQEPDTEGSGVGWCILQSRITPSAVFEHGHNSEHLGAGGTLHLLFLILMISLFGRYLLLPLLQMRKVWLREVK